MDELERITKNVRELRKKYDVSQSYIASVLEIDSSMISKIESGKVALTMKYIQKLAEILNMSIVDVMTYPDKFKITSDSNKDDGVKAILQIELNNEKKDQILKLVFGENNLKILNS